MKLMSLSLRALISLALILGISSQVIAETPKIGMVVMHGKGGTPSKHVNRFASTLEKDGYLVKNLEMPWSKKREYKAPVDTAVEEVDKAIESMRAQGATHIFVSGHSMGAGFALHYATIRDVNGIIGLAPGGNMGAKIFRKKLGKSVSKARKLVSKGKGDDTTRLMDFEGSKGTYPIIVTPNNYLSWFDPEGAMNMIKAAKQLRGDVAVLWAVAERDYKGLKKFGPKLFNNFLSSQPHATFYEPKSDHLGAPSASIGEVKRWVAQVAGL
ncbi:MAG: alpha/beta family hydrolase [Sedimenticola sp.]